MENPTISATISGQSIASQLLAQYRPIAKEYGRYFGEQIFTVICTNPDLKWKEDVLADRNTLRKEVSVFLLKAIDITSVEFLPKDLDGNPKIILNPKDNDSNLVFPLVRPEFTKANRATVTECIDRISKKGSKPMFFAAEELPELNKLLRLTNQSVLNFYEEQSRKNMKLADTVRNMIEQSERAEIEYLRQCGVTENETHIRMSVEISENE